MARIVIRKLSERELELLVFAGQRFEQANQAMTQAQNNAQMFQSQYLESLELLTGDKDPSTLTVDAENREVFRESSKNNARPKKRATTKGTKKPGGKS